jgi:hypothetical protein
LRFGAGHGRLLSRRSEMDSPTPKSISYYNNMGKDSDMSEKEIWNKLYDQMDKGLITYSEMMQEYAEFIGFDFQINEGIAR